VGILTLLIKEKVMISSKLVALWMTIPSCTDTYSGDKIMGEVMHLTSLY